MFHSIFLGEKINQIFCTVSCTVMCMLAREEIINLSAQIRWALKYNFKKNISRFHKYNRK